MIFHEEETLEAFREIEKLKGKERAKLLEKMARLETNHFRSKQWKLSKSFGMEMGAWHGIDESKFSTFQMKDNHLTGAKQMRTFIKWNSVYDFLLYLSDYIDRHKGNYARWNSMMPERQEAYRVKLKGIVNRTVK
jgi:hypothetical protein